MGRAPGSAERFALFKASPRSSGSSLCHWPLAMTELDTSYSPHSGQTMLTPSIVAGICSALAPQTGQFMFSLRWLRFDANQHTVGFGGSLLLPRAKAAYAPRRFGVIHHS